MQHSKRQKGRKLLLHKNVSGCFVNFVAVRISNVCSGVGGDLMAVPLTEGFDTLQRESGARNTLNILLPPARAGSQVCPVRRALLEATASS